MFAAGNVSLAWDASPDASVTGYRIYYGVASASYTNSATVGNVTNATVTGLVEGATYFFAATAFDGAGLESDFSNETSYTVPTSSTNQSPTLNALGNVTLNEDAGAQVVSLSGITSGSVSEIQTLTVTAVSSDPALIPNPTVSYTSPSVNGSLSFAPVANASGTATVTVTVNDGQAVNNVVRQTFTVTVDAINDAPTLNALNNLTLAENAAQQSLSLTGVGTGAANETQTLTVTATSSNPSLIPNPTVNYTSPNTSGSLIFTPVVNANGTATITVTVNDGQAINNTATRTFAVNVSAVNQRPTLAAISDVTINEDASGQTVGLTGVGTGATNESQTLSITAVSSNPSLIPNPSVSYSSPNASGNLSFTPVANANGNATITVTVNDGQALNNTVSQSFLVTVIPVNDAPTLNVLGNLNVAENATQQTVSLAGISPGAANETQVVTITASSSDTAIVPNPTVSYTSANATGTLSFTPVASANGTATITVTVNDGQAVNNTTTRTFTVNVSAVNNAPTLAALNNVTISEDASMQTVTLTDISTGAANETQTLSITATSSNPGLIPNPTVNYTSPDASGSLTFTPATNGNGTATITVTVNDGQAINNTSTRTFGVTVTPLNDAPSLNALNNLTVNEDATVQTINLSGISSGAANEAQTLTLTATSSDPSLIPNPIVSYTSPNTTGSLSFTPVANANGTATITVTVSDGQALNNTTTQSFAVTVNPVNDPPTLNAINGMTIAENAGTQIVNLGGIGSGAANETQTLSVTATSSNPSLVANPTMNYSSPGTTGSLSFTPVANINGSVTITVTVNDGQATNNVVTRTFAVTVTSVNSAPTISSIPSQTVVSGAGSGPINFTIGDVETAAAQLSLSVSSSATAILPTANIVFGGNNSNRTVTLTPAAGQVGTANVTITVGDGAAASSTTFLVTVQAQTSQLSVNKSGAGTVTPDLSSAPLIVGQSYTVTATPAVGYVFAGWSGGIQSSSPTLTFTMTAGLVLQANFTANPYVAAAGTYNGLFTESDEVRLPSAGAFNIYADTSGNYSGWVQIGYARHTVSGQFQLDSRATNVVTRWNNNPLTVELRLGQDNEAGQIFGRMTDGVWTASLAGGRAAYQTAGGAPQAGEYTVVFPGQVGDPNLPAGDGYGTLHVGADGLGTLSGTLADGTAFLQTAWLTAEGDWPMYVSLYAGKGALVSWLTFTNQASSDINGTVVWIKQANPAAAQYPAGFISDTKVVGSLYVPPTGANKSVNLSSAFVNFTAGNLASDFSNSVSVNAGSQVVNLSPNALTLTISSTLGSFTGQVAEPGSGVMHSFGGVVLQKQNAGFGFMLGSTRSSLVTLAAP